MSNSKKTLDQQEQATETDQLETEVLAAEIDILREENQRLRKSYALAKQTTYRRAALGFGLIGAISLMGAAIFPSLQTIFVALGGTGLFTGLATYYLTPETFVSAQVSESVYGAYSDLTSGLVAELDLQDEYVYIPTPEIAATSVRLFIPQHVAYEIPETDELRSLFVTGASEAEYGVSLPPTGGRLYREFKQSQRQPLAEKPDEIALQLTEALTDQFELAARTRLELDDSRNQVTVGIIKPSHSEVTSIDHPIASFLGTGMAAGLTIPVKVAVKDGNERSDSLITLRWD